MQKEYYSTSEISNLLNLSVRHVRRLVTKKEKEIKNKYLIHKDKNGDWRIHELLTSHFTPKNILKSKYYAFSFDPISSYSEDELHEIMKYIMNSSHEFVSEINYVIHQKNKNQLNHVHMYLKSSNRNKFISTVREALGEISYKQNAIFDLDGWKGYMNKDNNNNITTLTN
jgi:hypothetical protein